jgi:hypothetical protein
MKIKPGKFGIGSIFLTDSDMAFPLFGYEYIKEKVKRK